MFAEKRRALGYGATRTQERRSYCLIRAETHGGCISAGTPCEWWVSHLKDDLPFYFGAIAREARPFDTSKMLLEVTS
jgi:hypothetical protein